jgi:CrcB protein
VGLVPDESGATEPGTARPFSPGGTPEDDAVESRAGAEVDLHVAASRPLAGDPQWDVLGVIAAGGSLGALSRYAVGVALPYAPGSFPWSTLLVNLSGCLLIGVLMVVILEIAEPHRLARPFLGVGVLGGYTTFSAVSVELQQLLDAHRSATALAYVVASLGGALIAVWAGVTLTRIGELVRTRRPHGGQE